MGRLINISGNKYNDLLALDNYIKINNRTTWLFKCDCGVEKFITKDNVIRGKVRHCGCKTSESRSKIHLIDIKNQKYGRWTAISFSHIHNGQHYWNFKCDCGKDKIVQKSSVRAGESTSCGCYQKEVIKFIDRRKLPFGESAFNKVLHGYKMSANKRKLIFELTNTQFKSLIDRNCYYCNIEPSQESKTHSKDPYYYNGIDRIDNTVGYIVENCRPCCKTCNYAKHNMTEEQFYIWLKRIYHHQVSLNNVS